MRRIALLTPTFHQFSGIDRVVEDQAKRFTAQGDLATVFCFEGSITVPGVEVVQLGMPKSLFWQRVYRLFFFLDVVKLRRAVRMLKTYDIAYSHMYPMNLIAMRAKRQYGCAYWYHDAGIPPTSAFHTIVEKAYIALFRMLTVMTIRTADRIVSISKFLADTIYRETGKRREVEHVPIDASRYHTGIDGRAVRKKYLLGNHPLVVFVGRLSPHKGVDLLIRAFNDLRSTIQNAHLFIIGKPTFAAYLKQLTSIAGPGIEFLGFVPEDELPLFYTAADVYATATLWEGFDLPIAEAQACGTMVVAFDIGPHREIINEHGILVPPRDIQSFSRALAQALSRKAT